jgi:hypothetical protein
MVIVEPGPDPRRYDFCVCPAQEIAQPADVGVNAPVIRPTDHGV